MNIIESVNSLSSRDYESGNFIFNISDKIINEFVLMRWIISFKCQTN